MVYEFNIIIKYDQNQIRLQFLKRIFLFDFSENTTYILEIMKHIDKEKVHHFAHGKKQLKITNCICYIPVNKSLL